MNLLIPKFLHAIAVVPIPMNGSQVVISGFMLCSLMHISGSLTGNGEGWSNLTFGQLQMIDRKIEFSHRSKALNLHDGINKSTNEYQYRWKEHALNLCRRSTCTSIFTGLVINAIKQIAQWSCNRSWVYLYDYHTCRLSLLTYRYQRLSPHNKNSIGVSDKKVGYFTMTAPFIHGWIRHV